MTASKATKKTSAKKPSVSKKQNRVQRLLSKVKSYLNRVSRVFSRDSLINLALMTFIGTELFYLVFDVLMF